MVKALSAGLLLVSGAAFAEGGSTGSAFGPGEQTTYAVEYLGVTAGRAQITVGAAMKQWGKEVWPIVSIAQTESLAAIYPIRDKFVTYWHPPTQRTLGSDLYADENRKRRRQQIRIDSENAKASVLKQKQGDPPVERTYDVHPDSLDIAAVAFSLRNKSLEEGQRYEVPVFTGAKSFNLVATVEGREQLKTKIGVREVFKVRIRTQFSGKFVAKRDIVAYFTSDPSHVPVRLEADFILGSLVANIVDYKPGRSVAWVGENRGEARASQP